MGKKYPIKHVPCNSCTICCQGDAVRLENEDSPFEYKTEPHPFIPGALMLAHKPNGECIYLEKDGCSIHSHAPSLCRAADCRILALRYDYASARQLHAMNRLDIRVWDQGYKLLERTREGNENSSREDGGQRPL
jgi:Fe-S-cluster containining protein